MHFTKKNFRDHFASFLHFVRTFEISIQAVLRKNAKFLRSRKCEIFAKKKIVSRKNAKLSQKNESENFEKKMKLCKKKPAWKDYNARFTTVALKAFCPIKFNCHKNFPKRDWS